MRTLEGQGGYDYQYISTMLPAKTLLQYKTGRKTFALKKLIFPIYSTEHKHYCIMVFLLKKKMILWGDPLTSAENTH